MKGKQRGRLIRAAHELNKQIQANPRKSLKTTQAFYAEKVEKGETEEAEFALLMNSMMVAREEGVTSVPAWFKAVGFVFGGLTLAFLMLLVFASMFGYTVPRESRFLVHLAFSLSSAFCVAALGGEAAASGKIPFVGKHPLAFSATGGLAVLIIMLAVLHWLYPVGP